MDHENGRHAHFPKCAKLLKPAEYKQVFDSAQRVSDRHLTLFFRVNDLKHARLGLAISKKVSKLAVDRNRIKRLARESFRLQQQNLPDVDCVVLARPSAVKADNKEIAAGFARLWEKMQKNLQKDQNTK